MNVFLPNFCHPDCEALLSKINFRNVFAAFWLFLKVFPPLVILSKAKDLTSWAFDEILRFAQDDKEISRSVSMEYIVDDGSWETAFILSEHLSCTAVRRTKVEESYLDRSDASYKFQLSA